MKRLKLQRPLCFFDLETSGKEVITARIIEMCVIKHYPDGSKAHMVWLFNPEVAISEEASAVHGYTNEMLKDKPTFKEKSVEIYNMIKNCDIGGYNSNRFDVPIIFYEFDRANIHYDYTQVDFIDVKNIFTIEEPRTLTAAHKFYTGKSLEGAHAAMIDVQATIDVLEAQYEKYPGLPITVKELASYSSYGERPIDLTGKFGRDKQGDIIFTFGKHKGAKVLDNINYLEWMRAQDFPADVNVVISKLLAGVKI